MAEEVLYEVAGGVARVTINRPERRNALAPSTVTGLREAVARAGADAAVRVVVVTGAGERAFCAGADLVALATPEAAGLPSELAALFGDLWALGKPTVARVRGYALAGGFGLAVACDLVVAADDAVFATPEIDVGLWPFVASVPLARAMPPRKALELMMTGRRVGAEEGERLGFVARVVPAADLDPAVDELAATLAAKPAGPMRAGRTSFYEVWGLGPEEALERLRLRLGQAVASGDARAGAAAFAARRGGGSPSPPGAPPGGARP
ncbi:MAG TPA: enoyl-CoA hydratase/isomerase family protein [Acidimicrobiales bacterium]|nr:enoyl-CoA hydratase/isomerase family protein [Acidimicrobiales bacterium]